MGVLKNDVGRPTNKTIMIRNILKGIGLLIVIGLAFGLGFYLKNDGNNKVSSNENVSVEKKLSLDSEEVKNLYRVFDRSFSAIGAEELFSKNVVTVDDLSSEYKKSLALAGLYRSLTEESKEKLKSSILEEYYHKLFGKNIKYEAGTFVDHKYDKKENCYYLSPAAGDWNPDMYADKLYKAVKKDDKIELYIYAVVYKLNYEKRIIGVYKTENDAKYYRNPLKEFNYDFFDSDPSKMEDIEEFKDLTYHYKLTFEKEDENYIFKQIEKIASKEVLEEGKIYDKYDIKETEDETDGEVYSEILFEGKKLNLNLEYKYWVTDFFVKNKLVYITTQAPDETKLFILNEEGKILLSSDNLSGEMYGEFSINENKIISISSDNYGQDDQFALCNAEPSKVMEFIDEYKYSNGKLSKVKTINGLTAKDAIEKNNYKCEK